MHHFNKIFAEYKNAHLNETATLFCTGPTLDDYDDAAHPHSVKVGVNYIWRHKFFNQAHEDAILLDYYFFGHRREYGNEISVEEWGDSEKTAKAKTGSFIPEGFKTNKQKFCISIVNGGESHDHYSVKEATDIDAVPIAAEHGSVFPLDISRSPLYSHSIPMPAMQFLLYCGFKKIFLVGCDCSGHDYLCQMENWRALKDFIDSNYPHVEIVSVNPVSLKGLF
tara:strand:- start:1707 stop:2375 length:669 start_codon:yes stop_codon:yes gene_type:complete